MHEKGTMANQDFCVSVWITKPIILSELVEGEGTTKSSCFLPALRKYPSVYLAWRLFTFLANHFGLWSPLPSSVINPISLE